MVTQCWEDLCKLFPADISLRTKGARTWTDFERLSSQSSCFKGHKSGQTMIFIHNFSKFCLNRLTWHTVSHYVSGLKKLFTWRRQRSCCESLPLLEDGEELHNLGEARGVCWQGPLVKLSPSNGRTWQLQAKPTASARACRTGWGRRCECQAFGWVLESVGNPFPCVFFSLPPSSSNSDPAQCMRRCDVHRPAVAAYVRACTW